MDSRFSAIYIVILLVLVDNCYSGKIKAVPCPASRYSKQKCTIHEVIVDPCTEGTRESPCRLKRGTKFNLFFSFTPGFHAERLRSLPFWDGPNLPFPGMKGDGCSYTNCPVTPGVRQNYTQAVPIEKWFPPGQYPSVWRLWNEKNEQCCFLMNVKLV